MGARDLGGGPGGFLFRAEKQLENRRWRWALRDPSFRKLADTRRRVGAQLWKGLWVCGPPASVLAAQLCWGSSGPPRTAGKPAPEAASSRNQSICRLGPLGTQGLWRGRSGGPAGAPAHCPNTSSVFPPNLPGWPFCICDSSRKMHHLSPRKLPELGNSYYRSGAERHASSHHQLSTDPRPLHTSCRFHNSSSGRQRGKLRQCKAPWSISQLPSRGQRAQAGVGTSQPMGVGRPVELHPPINCCVTVGKSLTLSEPQPPPTLAVGGQQEHGRGRREPHGGWRVACLHWAARACAAPHWTREARELPLQTRRLGPLTARRCASQDPGPCRGRPSSQPWDVWFLTSHCGPRGRGVWTRQKR